MHIFPLFGVLFACATLLAQETTRERELLTRIDALEKRLAALEARLGPVASAPAPAVRVPPATTEPVATAIIPKEAEPGIAGLFRDTTINATVDGYYEYNFNKPGDRLSQLRVYDQSHNSFSLNQATVVLERTPNPEAGRRFGARIDLQFGQATQTLQGNSVSEPRPAIYRNVFQAYGSYVLPAGKGLQVDFGKFASSLGYETNYTKDNLNYSRSFWFNYLPYYHFGFRTNYAFNDKLAVQYWLVNGANQSEDFNGFKSQAFLAIIKPAKSVTWNATYYVGQEGHLPVLNALTAPDIGLQIPTVYPTTFNGRTHIFDTYINYSPANSKWSGALEGDYVVSRDSSSGSPSRVDGGAAYLQYQAAKRFALAGRFEILQDRGGAFTNQIQTLKEFTLTGTHQVIDGFQWRIEYRRDFSSVPFFITDRLNVLRRNQDTALLGLVWWFGGKTGAW